METMAMISKIVKTILDGTDSLGEVLSIVMTALDEWAMDHNVSPEELEDVMEASVDIMKEAHKIYGWEKETTND